MFVLISYNQNAFQRSESDSRSTNLLKLDREHIKIEIKSLYVHNQIIFVSHSNEASRVCRGRVVQGQPWVVQSRAGNQGLPELVRNFQNFVDPCSVRDFEFLDLVRSEIFRRLKFLLILILDFLVLVRSGSGNSVLVRGSLARS